MQPPRRGIPVGLFSVFGLIAVVLTAVMVVVLINPFNWTLPFGLGGGQVAGTQETEEAPVGEASPQPTPAGETTQPPAAQPTTPPEPTQVVAPPLPKRAETARAPAVSSSAGEGHGPVDRQWRSRGFGWRGCGLRVHGLEDAGAGQQ